VHIQAKSLLLGELYVELLLAGSAAGFALALVAAFFGSVVWDA